MKTLLSCLCIAALCCVLIPLSESAQELEKNQTASASNRRGQTPYESFK
ncbi:MAG: hypothetical protein P9M03_02960 [Candidatus Theseobacter exili]|nr:hypothetical protein [Candidatus Theseobacter exili]